MFIFILLQSIVDLEVAVWKKVATTTATATATTPPTAATSTASTTNTTSTTSTTSTTTTSPTATATTTTTFYFLVPVYTVLSVRFTIVKTWISPTAPELLICSYSTGFRILFSDRKILHHL